MIMMFTFAAEMTRRNRIPEVFTVSSSACTNASVLVIISLVMVMMMMGMTMVMMMMMGMMMASIMKLLRITMEGCDLTF